MSRCLTVIEARTNDPSERRPAARRQTCTPSREGGWADLRRRGRAARTGMLAGLFEDLAFRLRGDGSLGRSAPCMPPAANHAREERRDSSFRDAVVVGDRPAGAHGDDARDDLRWDDAHGAMLRTAHREPRAERVCIVHHAVVGAHRAR